MKSYKTLAEACWARDIEWDPERKLDPLFFATELGGEVGEVLNVVKKLHREQIGIPGSRTTIEHLGEEIADARICLQNLANKYGIDVDAVTAKKFNATSDKLGFETHLEEANA